MKIAFLASVVFWCVVGMVVAVLVGSPEQVIVSGLFVVCSTSVLLFNLLLPPVSHLEIRRAPVQEDWHADIVATLPESIQADFLPQKPLPLPVEDRYPDCSLWLD